jgi:hypothetical protein
MQGWNNLPSQSVINKENERAKEKWNEVTLESTGSKGSGKGVEQSFEIFTDHSDASRLKPKHDPLGGLKNTHIVKAQEKVLSNPMENMLEGEKEKAPKKKGLSVPVTTSGDGSRNTPVVIICTGGDEEMQYEELRARSYRERKREREKEEKKRNVIAPVIDEDKLLEARFEAALREEREKERERAKQLEVEREKVKQVEREKAKQLEREKERQLERENEKAKQLEKERLVAANKCE